MADLFPDRKGAADAGGVSPDQLGLYINGKTEKVPVGVLIGLCAPHGVNLQWLATGDGPKMRNEVREPAAGYGATTPNWDLLVSIIEAVETLIQEENRPMSPATRGRLIRAMYEYYAGKEKRLAHADRGKIMQIVKAAMAAGAMTDANAGRGRRDTE